MNQEEPSAKRLKRTNNEDTQAGDDKIALLRILLREIDFPLSLRLVCKQWNKIFMDMFLLSEARLREFLTSQTSQKVEHESNLARKVILWLQYLSQRYNRGFRTMFASLEVERLLVKTRYELSNVAPRRLITFSYSPYDIAITGNTLYVCDYTSNLRSYSLDIDYHLLQTFAFDHAPFSVACDPTTDQLRYPRGIAARDGLVYVADADNSRVSVFSANGVFFQHIGLNQLTSPHSIALDHQGRLLVTDSSHKVFIFSTADGTLLHTFGQRGLDCGAFNYPRGITVDLMGNILICDCDNSRIQIFDSNGEFLHSFGHRDDHSGKLGWFSYPSFISVDTSGNVFVSEWSVNRVQMF